MTVINIQQLHRKRYWAHDAWVNDKSILSNKNKNMKIVIIGGTGLIGAKLVSHLQKSGHEVLAAAPSRGINSVTGEEERLERERRTNS